MQTDQRSVHSSIRRWSSTDNRSAACKFFFLNNSYYLQAQLAAQKESGDQFNDVVSIDHLVNTSDAVESLWTCRRTSATLNKDYSLCLSTTKKCTIAMNTFSKESNMSIRKVVVSLLYLSNESIFSLTNNNQWFMMIDNILAFVLSSSNRLSFVFNVIIPVHRRLLHTHTLSWLPSSSTMSGHARIVEILCNIV